MIDEKKLIEQLKGYKSEWKLAEPFHEGIASGLQIAIEATEKQPKVGEWIPVSERLPETDGTYLCWCEGFIYPHACIRRFAKDLYSISKYDFTKESGEGFYYHEADWGYSKEKYIIAWMPLPEPYRKDVE